jgi:hypothetical protein
MVSVLNCEESHISLVSGTFDRRRPLDAAPLIGLNRRYALARESGDRAAVLEIGRALYAWLDGDEGWLSELRRQQPRPFILEIRGPLEPNAAEWSVLQAPWELLADDSGGFLAADTEYATHRHVVWANRQHSPRRWMTTGLAWRSWRRRRAGRGTSTSRRKRRRSCKPPARTSTCSSRRVATPKSLDGGWRI